jgi:glycosyltransferase involved in cell wall biosynthesis
MAENGHKVSVVIPLYNKEKYIRRTVDSVLDQTFADFELIIVNDGSTDQGPAIVREFTDSRIRLIDQENQGASGARNRGIKEARGELIAFLDADDEWLPDFLGTILRLSEEFPGAGLYATGWRWLFGTGAYQYQDVAIPGNSDRCGCYFDLFGKGGDVCSSSIAVRHVVLNRLPAFRVGQCLHQDLDMWFRIGLRYDFACSPRICALYHSYVLDSATHTVIFGRYSPLYISLQEMRADSTLDPYIRIRAERHLATHLAWLAKATLLKSNTELARQRLRDYRDAFGITRRYICLRCLALMPERVRRRLDRLRCWLRVRILALRNSAMGRKCELPTAGQLQRKH